MARNTDNRRRAFADVVSIDAWHEPFCDGTAIVDLHADVVFGTARVGGEIESKIRFRLSINRAEIILIIPDTEPVEVDRKSVSRDTPHVEGVHVKVVESTTRAGAKGDISSSISPTGIAATVEAKANAEASIATTEKLQVQTQVTSMHVTQSKTGDGNYRWIVETSAPGPLRGRPWDGTKPRLKLVDKRRDKTKGIPPTVRVEVRCQREDLVITDLEVKDESLWESITTRSGFRNRLAAAESFIRDQLAKEGLEARNISDKFGHLTLGSTTAESNG